MAQGAEIYPLVEIMEKLRTPGTGCPWDLEQDFASISPYTIEEAYEVADAIEKNDMVALKDELGDLLFQVVFHSQIAREVGHFSVQDVIDGICEKMVRRHPHVFAQVRADDAQAVLNNWEAIKASERRGMVGDPSALAGVAITLPALMRAQKLQKRAAATGFDWPEIEGAFAKLDEEIGEVRAANTDAERFEEVGDMLFATVNICRHLGIDAEVALKAANVKFETRFRAMEAAAGEAFAGLALEEKEALWQSAKLRA